MDEICDWKEEIQPRLKMVEITFVWQTKNPALTFSLHTCSLNITSFFISFTHCLMWVIHESSSLNSNSVQHWKRISARLIMCIKSFCAKLLVISVSTSLSYMWINSRTTCTWLQRLWQNQREIVLFARLGGNFNAAQTRGAYNHEQSASAAVESCIQNFILSSRTEKSTFYLS